MNHGLLLPARVVARARIVQFSQRANRVACEAQPRRRIPGVVASTLIEGGCGRVGNGEELQLTHVSRHVLERLDDAGRPRMQPQPKQGIEFATRPGLRI